MLLTPLIKRQLRIFAILATASLGLAFIHYARLPAMLGLGVYNVTVDFDDASGLYSRAAVTYRGVQVGVVSDLVNTGDRAVATLRIDNGTDIPKQAVAELHSTSAIGEQYIDLVDPSAAGAPQPAGSDAPSGYLDDGDNIPRERSVGMPQITPVLESVNALLKSVPKKQTKSVLNRIDEGLGGAGPELNGIIDASAKLLTEAQAQIDDTTSLIAALRPVLNTQADLAARTQGYAESLNTVTGVVAKNNSADLRQLLANAPGGLKAATTTVKDLQRSLPMLVANLTTNAQVLNTYLPEVKQILVLYPSLVARLQSAINPRAGLGDVKLDLRAGANDPAPCGDGYVAVSQRRAPGITTTRPVNRLAHCRIAPANPTAIRGDRNLPCPTSARRGPLPESCGLTFRGAVWPSRSGNVAYDIAVGQGDREANQAIQVGSSGEDASELWKILVLAPLARR